ncbi:MAG: hypothetical protein HQL64_08095 [Magnetococcales bacterium]|nr:hypothetical protein [Magnetococcales bacterium]
MNKIENEILRDIQKFLYTGERSISFLEYVEKNREKKNEEKLTGEDSDIARHDNISADVFRRLLFRHAILQKLYHLELYVIGEKKYIGEQQGKLPTTPGVTISLQETQQPASEQTQTAEKSQNNSVGEKKENQTTECNNRRYLNQGGMAYNLAATDLFVEKALAYLEDHAKPFIEKGNDAFNQARKIMTIAILLSFIQTFFLPYIFPSENLDWQHIIASFTRSSTLYGLLVLMAVAYRQYGKAMLDQAERLSERRHALRQGRLFVHLSDGSLSIDELIKAFEWNVNNTNAFGNIPTEALAPTSSIIKEFTKAISDVGRIAMDAAKKEKDGKS